MQLRNTEYEVKKMSFFVDYCWVLILVGSPLWSGSVCERIPGYKIDTSPSVTVQRGLCVHVPCSFTVPRVILLSIFTTGKWCQVYKEEGQNVASKSNFIHLTNGRFFLTGNVARGDCSYSIEDPLFIDEGRYYFRLEDGLIKFNYQDVQPYVNVTDLTDKPTISSTRLVDGEEVTLTCTSPGRCRNIRPQITWEGTMTGIRQKMYDITYRDGSRTFHSNITFTPRKSHNNSTLFCRVTFKSGVTTVEEISLNVEYKKLQLSVVIAATVGGVLLLVLIIVIATLLIKGFRKKTHQNNNGKWKDNLNPPEEDLSIDLHSSAGEDSVNLHCGDLPYASIEFSKVKPKEIVPEVTETEYSEIRKTEDN